MRFEALIGIRLVSHDAATLAAFYRAALGFVVGNTVTIDAAEMALLGLTGSGTRTALTLAGQRLDIDQFDPPGRAYPLPPLRYAANARPFQHFAIVTANLSEDWARALAAGAQPISRDPPVQLPPANGSVVAVKFRDPEGHPLELLQFPAPSLPLPRIDHSAIVVSNSAASLAFYARHRLKIGARTTNHGPAQAALDGLDDPWVDVVALHPGGPGAHLELLAYAALAPGGAGRRPDDVAATRLVWQAQGAALITDPDGHLHQCQPQNMPPASPPATA